ncbi:MAG TPA: histidine phosphatase family protein [Micromonosporaceae bacterium]|jgi:probable phosphoglycerate mutase
MRTRVLLVRHGDSQHKVDGVIGGPRGDRGLTEVGRAQAQALAYRLESEVGGTVAVYSSTLPRAIQTAEPIAAALRVTADADCGLCTWHYPEHGDGLPLQEYSDRFGLAGGGVFRPFQKGAESWSEMVARTSRTLVDLATKHRGETLILVCHAETVGISFHAYGLLGPYRQFDLVVDSASVTEWITDDNPAAFPPARWSLVRFNHREI